MKKYIVGILLVVVMALFAYDDYQKNIVKSFEAYIYNSDDKITLIDDKGSLYEIDVLDENITFENTGLMIGNKVNLEYKGDIKGNELIQDIEVLNMHVYDNENYEFEKIDVDENLALKYLDNMTLSQKVGQMFFVLIDESVALDEIREYDLGGILLFYKDFKDKTKEEVINMINNYQSVSSIPLFIGVDEEGGVVNRVSLNKDICEEPFKSPSELYEVGGFDMIISDTYNKINILKELGININFAPVADVSLNQNNYIHERTFTKDAKMTATYVKLVTSIMHENHLGSVLKHFPGYGDNVDTHSDIGIDNRKIDDFYNNDFIPFIEGIKGNASMVLMSHNIISDVDNMPSSLSIKMHDILKEELGFDGVIITDDLAMNGIMNLFDEKEAVIKAINAGNHMICTTKYQKMLEAVIDAVNSGEISTQIIDEAVLKILNLKIKLGIIQ